LCACLIRGAPQSCGVPLAIPPCDAESADTKMGRFQQAGGERVSFVKLLLGIAFMSAILFFAVLNLEETVDIRLWTDSSHMYREVPLVVAMLCAYLIGIVTYFAIALARDVRMRGQISRLRRENRGLIDELHHLRGSALDDLPTVEVAETRNEVRIR
jgi:uncharacterized integral membrane protein